MDYQTHAKFILEFIDTFRRNAHADIGVRELACLNARIPYILGGIQDGDLYAGRYRNLAVGFSPQEGTDLGYFFVPSIYEEVYNGVDAETQKKLAGAVGYYRDQTTAKHVRAGYPPEIAAVLPSDFFTEEAGIAFPLYRMSGAHPDYAKLVRLGVPGFRALLSAKLEETDNILYRNMLGCFDLFCEVCGYYRAQAMQKGLDEIAQTLHNITVQPPQTMREAIQLVHIHALLSGALNYGRVDDYLGRFADEENALELVIGFYKMISARGCTWDGRVVVGGMGRENEAQADRFALIAMEASERYRDILPQLTLRFYDGQNPALLEKAYDNFAKGCVYPMLYRDEVNVRAVRDAFDIDEESAKQYLPFGCGEYVLYHRSVGTPSGVINLLTALNNTLENDFDTFEGLFGAYQSLVEKNVDALAWQEKYEYECAGKTASYLFLSMLFDDCIERGRAIYDGGIWHLGGTLESYGNINTADSLTAIKELVYDKKVFTLGQLREMLQCNFEGFGDAHRMLLNCPKYGNDNDTADGMAIRVHEHICNYTRNAAKKVGLDSYLVVIINNNANTTMGQKTTASADGRLAYEPMANANNPSGGSDKSGVTAFLNSLVKLDNTIHAGAVQNMKFSRELIADHSDKFKMLMKTYFTKGQQAMLNILSRGDLEDALEYPEKHANLIVRVGGFSARFVELDRKTQEEILSRTLHS